MKPSREAWDTFAAIVFCIVVLTSCALIVF